MRELVGNVSLRVLPTERPDTWEVQGRGELALAVLVETMRREGYELTVGRPTVVTKEIDGGIHEPVERLAVDVPEEYLGAVTGLLATAALLGPARLADRLERDWDAHLGIERELQAHPELADIGKQLLVTGRRAAAGTSDRDPRGLEAGR